MTNKHGGTRAASAPPLGRVMSKQQHHNKPQAKAAEVAKVQREAKEHMRCPSCYGGRGGVGVPNGWARMNGSLVKRYYKCDTCGHTWSAIVKTHTTILAIEHREIEVKYGDAEMEER